MSWYLVLIVTALLLLALVWLMVRGLARLTTWIAGSELSAASRRWITAVLFAVTLSSVVFLVLLPIDMGGPAGRNRSSAFHRAVMVGLEHYRSEFGEYPVPSVTDVTVNLDGHDYDASGALMLYQALSGDGDDHIKTALHGKHASDGRLDDDELKHICLSDMPREMIRKTEVGYMLVDGFGHPYQYTPGGAECVNDTFDLWSFAEAAPSAFITKATKSSEASARWIRNW